MARGKEPEGYKFHEFAEAGVLGKIGIIIVETFMFCWKILIFSCKLLMPILNFIGLLTWGTLIIISLGKIRGPAPRVQSTHNHFYEGDGGDF